MQILAGLGNPGSKYAHNRHNIGFMAVDEIFRRHSFSPWRKKFRAEVADGTINGQKVLLIKPQTMMNLSGDAVGEAMRFYKLAPGDITVLYDELDLAPGKVRIKTGGGHGGHNGIKSIDAHCGRDYRRVRLGIGHPGHKDRVTGHVLGDFAKSDQEWLEPLLQAIGADAGLLVTGDDSGFLNRIALACGNKGAAGKTPSANAASSGGKPPQKAKGAKSAPKPQSHVRQARQTGPSVNLPKTGPMADMLKKLLKK